MSKDSKSVFSRASFCVSDSRGDIGGEGEQGLFYRDTRHLSRLDLTVDGEVPDLLSSHAEGGEAGFFLSAATPGSGRGLSVIRRRNLPAYSGGFEEEVLLVNHTRETVYATLEVHLDADFADLFEVRGVVPRRRREGIERRAEGDVLSISYRREDFHRETRVTVETAGGAEVTPSGVSVGVSLPAREERAVSLMVEALDGTAYEPVEGVEGVGGGSTEVSTDHEHLARTWVAGLADLESLRFRPGVGEAEVFAAGAPWFMALFGRDSLIACYQTLPLGPERTVDTLRLLARFQGREVDAFRDEEPGKIPHELRLGEATHFAETPHSPYYGTFDATPLFLIVLHELWRWTADATLIKEFEPPARLALEWVSARLTSGGYITYSPNPDGLINQGWKDSENSALFRDGTRASSPIALCEAQGYAYDACLRAAELADKVWEDHGLASDLKEKAADLAVRFDRDFWMEERGCYALALDGEGRRVDSVTSNAGHLLWSGLVPEERVGRLVETLMAPASFGGWGVRTMASTEGGYNPIEYHNGAVWPHDNSLIARGLARYGYREEANRVALALAEAASHFDYRLPEVFAGYDRDVARFPVEYPTSCSPQAWAAGSVVLLVRSMLGLEPDPESRLLKTDPTLPEGVSRLSLEGVVAFGKRHRVGAG